VFSPIFFVDWVCNLETVDARLLNAIRSDVWAEDFMVTAIHEVYEIEQNSIPLLSHPALPTSKPKRHKARRPTDITDYKCTEE
jgi:hypothetical protein